MFRIGPELFIAIVNEPRIPKWAGICINIRSNMFSSGTIKIINLDSSFSGQPKNILYIPGGVMFNPRENKNLL